MTTALNRRARLLLMLMGSLVALSLGLISGPAAAEASTSNYCTGSLGASKECVGSSRWLYQTYGWGDQASVCVSITYWMGPTCSAGAGAGAYSGRIGQHVYSSPWIKNNSGISNFVHGVALTY